MFKKIWIVLFFSLHLYQYSQLKNLQDEKFKMYFQWNFIKWFYLYFRK